MSKASVIKAAKAALKNGGVVAAIKSLHKKGFENAQIIEMGFNRNTVYRQVREADRADQGGKRAPKK